MTPYTPTPYDKLWASAPLRMLADGGVMVWPATMVMWRVDHKAKLLKCLNPEVLVLYPELEERTREVFKAVGYGIEVKID